MTQRCNLYPPSVTCPRLSDLTRACTLNRPSLQTLSGDQPVPLRQRLKSLDRVFVAVLGVDGLAGAEIDRLAVDAHLLPLGAGKMHFDAVVLAIVAGVMLERGEIEIGAEFAIDARQQIEIELRGHALGVVIGRA